MKKIVSLILTLITAFSLCACGMTNDGYVTDNPAATIEPKITPAPGSANGGTVNGNGSGSGSVIDDSTLVSPSPMPTASVSSPAPTDASGTSTPAESARPSENPTK